eukprot:gene12056-13299_t
MREGIGAGTFHHLGYTPNMETCVDLCCKMPLCGVAFKAKDRCYGIECVSDDSCESVETEAADETVEISHVRAGKRPANATDMNMAGQCRPSPIYKEVTLKGGIHAGTYKDVGGVSTMEECQKKCCEFPACDLALILASSCYLVGCADHKSCELQPAKKSNFHPSVSYVTRWNSEGVKHTVQLQEKNTVKHTCPPLKPLDKVTLKGGLQTGDFTDVGKVNDLAQCYDICCQQDNCDLAFLLAQNCFSVQCKDKRTCGTVPAQPSIFNPQIAYITSRMPGGGADTTVKSAPSNSTGKSMESSPLKCPATKILDKVTLKGGVDAGDFHDNGKVDDMDKCRRICCEMTQCHLAFMLGSNCFSVKCHDVDSCKAQTAKPSSFYPRISYIRKVGTNELLKPESEKGTAKSQIEEAKEKFKETLRKPMEMTFLMGNLGDSQPANAPKKKQDVKSKAKIASQLAKLDEDVGKDKEGHLPGEEHKASSDCKPLSVVHNVTLKGGRKAGEFKEIPHVKNMEDCVSRCCDDKKCSLAFMLSNACYSVTCKNKDLCSTIPAPPSGFHPQVAMVRLQQGESKLQSKLDKLDALPEPAVKVAVPEGKAESAVKKPEKPVEKPTKKPEKPVNKDVKKSCSHKPVVKGKSLKGGKKSGKFRFFKGVTDMKTCISKCCAMDKNCDVAYMEGGKCYSISCPNKGLCMAVDKKSASSTPVFAYMDHFLGGGEEAVSTELDQGLELSEDSKLLGHNTDNKACSNVEIAHNVTLKGGTRAGIFKEMGKMTDMKNCVTSCCDRPECDIAYLLNGHCFAVQCTDGKLCQATAEPAKAGDNVALAYMNKAGLGEYKRVQLVVLPLTYFPHVSLTDFFVVYIIAGSLAFVAIAGGLIWGIFVFSKRQKLKNRKGRLLEDEEESVDDLDTRRKFAINF